MARIEIRCTKCGACHVGNNVGEAMAWSDEHDRHCVGPASKSD